MMLTMLVVLQNMGNLVYYRYMMLIMLVVLQIVENLVYYCYMMLLLLHDANDASCAADRGELGLLPLHESSHCGT